MGVLRAVSLSSGRGEAAAGDPGHRRAHASSDIRRPEEHDLPEAHDQRDTASVPSGTVQHPLRAGRHDAADGRRPKQRSAAAGAERRRGGLLDTGDAAPTRPVPAALRALRRPGHLLPGAVEALVAQAVAVHPVQRGAAHLHRAELCARGDVVRDRADPAAVRAGRVRR